MDSDSKKYVPPHFRSRQGSARSKPPSPEQDMDLSKQVELKRSIMEALKKPLVKGDVWYLCDRVWFNKFNRYSSHWCSDSLSDSDSYSDSDSLSESDSEKLEEATGLPPSHPGKIDLSGLYSNSKCDIKSPLYSYEFIAIHENGWRRLVKEFGIKVGQKPIRREVVSKGAPRDTELEVEVNLLKLNFALNDNIDCVRWAPCSRNRTLRKCSTQFI